MRVNNCVAGASIPSRVCPHPFHQCRTNLFPKPASDCGVIKIRHCGVRWKIVGQISPFASVIYKIQHRVYQFPLFPFAPVSCSGKQRRHDRPLTVAQITRITASLIFLYHVPIIALPFLLVQLLSLLIRGFCLPATTGHRMGIIDTQRLHNSSVGMPKPMNRSVGDSRFFAHRMHTLS